MVVNVQVLSSQVWLTTTHHSQAQGGPAGALVPGLVTNNLTWTNASPPGLNKMLCHLVCSCLLSDREQTGELKRGSEPTFQSWSKHAFPAPREAHQQKTFPTKSQSSWPFDLGDVRCCPPVTANWSSANRSHHLAKPASPSLTSVSGLETTVCMRV